MYDYLIKDVTIIDGSGSEPVRGNVAVAGTQIAAVGRTGEVEAVHVIDGDGRVLTPGFIDIHRHADAAVFRPDFGRAELAQGLTTIINGNCGLSLAPVSGPHQEAVLDYLSPIVGRADVNFPTLADYRRAVNEAAPPLYTEMLVGMGTLRADAAGFRDGELSDAEYRTLHGLLECALSDGALGVSLGLGYAPECFYTTEQLIRALMPLRRSGRVVTVHMRQEGDGVVEALREMLKVAEALETPLEISHLKAIGQRNWGTAVPEMLRLIAKAREAGLDVMCDAYPYPAGATQLIHVLPPEFQSGGVDALTEALQSPQSRQKIRRRMENDSDFENIVALVGFENVRAMSLQQPENIAFEGRSIAEIADSRNQDPYDALFDLLSSEHCAVSMIDFISSEADIEEIFRADFSGVISDATYPAGLPHPRVYGAFPRLLETYVRRRGVLTLPEAIRKITRQPADRFGLSQKGRIESGADADLCLFDPDRIHETATWEEPAQFAQGMDYVFVDGVPTQCAKRIAD